jgi:hypothetical protein
MGTEFNRTLSASAPLTWLNVSGFNIAARGSGNLQAEEITSDFKKNRLLPRLISKQVNMLYGLGPAVYTQAIVSGKEQKVWVEQPQIMSRLESWTDKGMENDYKSFAKAAIKNFYFFRDFFVKWRMNTGSIAGLPSGVAGLEMMEDKNCRLATARKDVANDITGYNDLKFVAVGKWGYGITNYKFYPRFTLSDSDKIRYAGISHHREKSVGEYYGENETHAGTRGYIRGSNQTSKSGADVFYNYLIYLMSLTPDDETCSEPFNMAVRINFPELYAQGFRIGFYRETPSRQEEVPVNNRLQNQQP